MSFKPSNSMVDNLPSQQVKTPQESTNFETNQIKTDKIESSKNGVNLND